VSKFKLTIQTINSEKVTVEADSLEIAIYKAENETLPVGTFRQNEVVSRKVTSASIVQETETEQELPSTE
tara:strand:- start:96 stop:305 length:210 start_codon:yes stop_codon:yes gene_type:complete